MFKEKYIMYCPVCGYIDGEHTKTVCPFCNHELKDSDHPLKEMQGKQRWEIEPIIEDIVRRLVRYDPDFRQSVYMNRLKEEAERSRIAKEAAHQAQVAMWKRINAERAANAPRCPTCGSTDLKKIDALDRAISVSFLGLASGKIGKSFKCNHCGYMW
jgi:hypothetical protein|nr:MAG TPA: RNA polymerase I [Caudoviricetes sp.]